MQRQPVRYTSKQSEHQHPRKINGHLPQKSPPKIIIIVTIIIIIIVIIIEV